MRCEKKEKKYISKNNNNVKYTSTFFKNIYKATYYFTSYFFV